MPPGRLNLDRTSDPVLINRWTAASYTMNLSKQSDNPEEPHDETPPQWQRARAAYLSYRPALQSNLLSVNRSKT